MATPSRLLLFAVALLGAAGCGGEAKNSLRLVVATEAAYRPFEFKDETGAIVGFDIDLMREVAREAGLEAEFVDQPFAGLLPGLHQGKYDAAISCITIKPERALEADFTEPYYDAGQVVAVPAKDAATRGTADLAGKVVAVQQGTTGEDAAKRVPGARVKSFESTEMAFLEVLAGRADAVINDEPTTRIYVKDHPGLRVAGAPFTQEQYGIAVRKGNAALLAKLNDGLKKARASGAWARLKEKWIGGAGR